MQDGDVDPSLRDFVTLMLHLVDEIVPSFREILQFGLNSLDGFRLGVHVGNHVLSQCRQIVESFVLCLHLSLDRLELFNLWMDMDE